MDGGSTGLPPLPRHPPLGVFARLRRFLIRVIGAAVRERMRRPRSSHFRGAVQRPRGRRQLRIGSLASAGRQRRPHCAGQDRAMPALRFRTRKCHTSQCHRDASGALQRAPRVTLPKSPPLGRSAATIACPKRDHCPRRSLVDSAAWPTRERRHARWTLVRHLQRQFRAESRFCRMMMRKCPAAIRSSAMARPLA